MSDISFTRQEVADEAGCDPWKERTDFQNETDAEEIFTLSSVFRNGSEVAEETGSVAQYASDLEERAGTRGSNAIYENAAEHLVQTHADLGGENLEVIARILGEVAEEVETVVEQNEDAITGDMGMNWQMDRHESGANSEFGSFETWLADQVYGVGSSLEYTIYDRTFTSVYGTFPVDDLRDHIKKTHLEMLASFATAVHEGITGRIEDYYSLLYRKESELGDYGYNTVDSPLDFWFTPGRAEYEAEQLEIELNKENPDPEKLDQYTSNLGRIAESVYGDPPMDPPGTLEDWQYEYLQTYYDTLSPDVFELLSGNMPAEEVGLGVGMGAVQRAELNAGFHRAQLALANGINMVTNPELLGENSRFRGDEAYIPASIAPFFDPWGGGSHTDPDGYGITAFNGFAETMTHATVAPGDDYAFKMANAAMEWWDYSQINPDPSGVWNTGSDDLLQSVSLNGGVSTQLLNDDVYLNRVLDAEWGDAPGAASLIRAGTMPEDGEPSEEQLDAARNVIMAAASEPDGERAWRIAVDLQDAISDVGIYHLDSLVVVEENGQVQDIFGEQTPGFNISKEEREAFYQFMARTSEDVQMSHIAGMQAYGYNESLKAFESGSVTAIDNVMERMGVITGVFEREQILHQFSEDKQDDKRAADVNAMWRTGTSVGISAVGAVATGGLSTAATWTGMGNSVMQAIIPPPTPTADNNLDLEQYEEVFNRGTPMRHVFVQAAADADYGSARQDMERLEIPDLHTASHRETAPLYESWAFHEKLKAVEMQEGVESGGGDLRASDYSWDESSYLDTRTPIIGADPFNRNKDD
ncbi:putative alpha/beta hydrolase [Streptomyces xiamenensis]|uniref:putative alpha/beta hydrolase n=1 Tax=Streptomyces xiamenensis TaxID=408015 RepID=UPI0037D2FC47